MFHVSDFDRQVSRVEYKPKEAIAVETGNHEWYITNLSWFTLAYQCFHDSGAFSMNGTEDLVLGHRGFGWMKIRSGRLETRIVRDCKFQVYFTSLQPLRIGCTHLKPVVISGPDHEAFLAFSYGADYLCLPVLLDQDRLDMIDKDMNIHVDLDDVRRALEILTDHKGLEFATRCPLGARINPWGRHLSHVKP